jgi:hypothetical protein
MHLKKVILEKHAKLGLFLSKSQSSMFLGDNFFYVHFVTKVSLYFLNLRKILRLLIPILSRYFKKIPALYSVLYSMTRTNAEVVTWKS